MGSTTRSPTRARLGRTALELFERRGYERVTTSEIAEAAGVSARTFYRHFPTKLDALVDDWHERTWEFVLALYRQPVQVDLRDALVAAIAEQQRDRPVGGDDLVRSRILRTTPSLAGAVRAYETELEGHLAEWIAQRSATSADRFEVRVTAAVLVAARRVVITEWLADGGHVPLVELARRALSAVRPLEPLDPATDG